MFWAFRLFGFWDGDDRVGDVAPAAGEGFFFLGDVIVGGGGVVFVVGIGGGEAVF